MFNEIFNSVRNNTNTTKEYFSIAQAAGLNENKDLFIRFMNKRFPDGLALIEARRYAFIFKTDINQLDETCKRIVDGMILEAKNEKEQDLKEAKVALESFDGVDLVVGEVMDAVKSVYESAELLWKESNNSKRYSAMGDDYNFVIDIDTSKISTNKDLKESADYNSTEGAELLATAIKKLNDGVASPEIKVNENTSVLISFKEAAEGKIAGIVWDNAKQSATPFQSIRQLKEAIVNEVFIYDVYLNGKKIDTLFYNQKEGESKFPEGSIKKDLIDKEGYDPKIEVKFRSFDSEGNEYKKQENNESEGEGSVEAGNKMTPAKAKKLIEDELKKLGLPYERITAKTISFQDLARDGKIFVKVHGWKPNPAGARLEQVARENGFKVDLGGVFGESRLAKFRKPVNERDIEDKKSNFICKDCGNLFQAKDDGQLGRCPKCNSRNSRHSTAMEDHRLRKDKMKESKEDKKSYDIQDQINAEYTLEPLKCRACGKVGEVVFDQAVGDASCQHCGEWQLDHPAPKSNKKMKESKVNETPSGMEGLGDRVEAAMAKIKKKRPMRKDIKDNMAESIKKRLAKFQKPVSEGTSTRKITKEEFLKKLKAGKYEIVSASSEADFNLTPEQAAEKFSDEFTESEEGVLTAVKKPKRATGTNAEWVNKQNGVKDTFVEFEPVKESKVNEKTEWQASDLKDAKPIGTGLSVIEFQSDDGEWHDFDVLETPDRIVFGGMTNSGFIESGYILKDGFSTDEVLQELLADLEVYYNDSPDAVSHIVHNQRM